MLGRGTGPRLTLISAPAGSGKSTLLADWIGSAPQTGSSAWLALERSDNELTRFWTYVVAALRLVAPSVGDDALRLLEERQPLDLALTSLVNDIDRAGHDLTLVLDDYHLIDAPDIQEGMEFLVEHLPERLYLVVSTRADPALPLARLRAQGRLSEIRAADLRFTDREAISYLNTTMGLKLTDAQVFALEERTEGWAVALQLAALSLQGRNDVPAFIAGFAGSDRYIVDYLVEEVLQRQPEHVSRFLTQTSILARLTGALCDAVTGDTDGRAMLETLERSNLLVVPLDNHRRWYRYHHLFADVLQARLLDGHAGQVADLHRRASEWFESNGDPSEAIRHAIAGEDFERAADLVEWAAPSLRRDRQEATLIRWFESLPREMYPARPVLSVGYVGALMAGGRFELVEPLLRYAEAWLEEPDGPHERSSAMVVANEEEYGRLPSAVALYRAAQARVLDDMAASKSHAMRAFELAGERDHLLRGGAAGILALGYWSEGDLNAAFRSWTDAADSLEQAGHRADVLGCTISRADIRLTQGRLSEALGIYERGLGLATHDDGSVHRGAADMHVGMCEVLCQRNDLEGARAHLAMADQLGITMGLPQNHYRSRVAAASVRRAEGDLDGALELLNEAERVYFGDFFPNVRPVPAIRARVVARAGRLSDALRWAEDSGVSMRDDLSYLREYEHVTLARVLLAKSHGEHGDRTRHEVIEFVNRLVEAAEMGGRTGNTIEMLIIKALAHDAAGDRTDALEGLEAALHLAEPEGYVRVFVEEGDALASLLRQARHSRDATGYVHRLLGAFGANEPRSTAQRGIVDPLTDRELQVLRLLAGDLAGPDIARELFVSLNTLRTHTKSIYTKLGVGTRREAVRRAAELDLLARSRLER